jgi:hypothetical protein
MDNVQKYNICTKYIKNKLIWIVIQGSGTNVGKNGYSEKYVGFYCVSCSVEGSSRQVDGKAFSPFR